MLTDKQPVSSIKHTDPIYCLELPQLKEANVDSGEYVLLCWINVLMLPDDQCTRYVGVSSEGIWRPTCYVWLYRNDRPLKPSKESYVEDYLTTLRVYKNVEASYFYAFVRNFFTDPVIQCSI